MAAIFYACFISFLLPFSVSSHPFSDIFFNFETTHACKNLTETEANCTGVKVAWNSKNSSIVISLRLFGNDYRILLQRFQSSIFAPNARVYFDDNNTRGTIPSSYFLSLPIYEGIGVHGTYVCGSVLDNMFSGYLMLSNGSSIYIESAERWNSPDLNESSELVIYRASDVKFKECSLQSNFSEACQENGFSRSLYCNRENERKISCFLNANSSENMQSFFTSIPIDLKTTRRPPSYSARKASCTVHLSADLTYFIKHGHNLENVLTEMLLVFKQVNWILSSIDFDGDGHQDGFIIRIGSVAVKGNEFISENSSRTYNASALSKLLKDFTNTPQGDCLSLMFTSIPRKTNWVSVAYEGGICKNNDSEPEPAKNIAVINTVDSSGRWRPFFTTAWAAVMAIGHVMDSANSACDSSPPYPPEEDWTAFFSNCGRRNIAHTLKHQGSCLNYPDEEILHHKTVKVLPKSYNNTKSAPCGNGQVDSGEECDCGSKVECERKSSCCVSPGEKNECQYDRSKGYECDWSDQCCTRDCKIIPESLNVFCGSGDASCAPAGSFCNGRSPHCPVQRSALSVRDGDTCGPANLRLAGAATCKAGRCSRTVCEDAGLVDCMCTVDSGYECRVCCRRKSDAFKKDNETQAVCVPAENFGQKSKKGNFFFRYPGTPCSEVRFGHCDKYGVCRQFQTVGISRAIALWHSYCSINFFLFSFITEATAIWITKC